MIFFYSITKKVIRRIHRIVRLKWPITKFIFELLGPSKDGLSKDVTAKWFTPIRNQIYRKISIKNIGYRPILK